MTDIFALLGTLLFLLWWLAVFILGTLVVLVIPAALLALIVRLVRGPG